MKKITIIMHLLLLTVISCKRGDMPKLETVDYVNLEKFMGDWYVIAIIPNFIEKNAVNGIESYQLLTNDRVKIDYKFAKKTPEGKVKHLEPKAWIYDTESNAEWRVQFFWPLKVPYLIIDLPEDYSYTVIGEPSRKFVWIMARKPRLADETYQRILQKLAKMGYETDKIEKMPQIWK